MAWVYAFWALAALALAGVVADIASLVRGRSRGLAITSLVLKGLTAAAFAAWFIAERQDVFKRLGEWSDLTTLALVILFGCGALGVALVCDFVVLVRMGSAEPRLQSAGRGGRGSSRRRSRV